ncbi:MAG: PQQ-binding-like beta-propeller repeat protein [Spirochaetales bacterium]|nr:PQQ-binding-like beta-propeller repeat protein [Spirochaetales bacterium]
MSDESIGRALSFSTLASGLATAATAAVFGILLVSWFVRPELPALSADLPGRDNRPSSPSEDSTAGAPVGAYFQKYAGLPAKDKGAWPRFRGAGFDNRSRPPLPLSPPFSLAPLWSVPLGEGHSGPVVAGGRVFILDYDEARKSDELRCLSLAGGAEIWRRWYPVSLKRNHGFSRSIPAVSGDYVVSMGPAGHVMCARAASGDFVWGIDVAKEYKSEIPQWYAAQCPLVDGGEAVIAAAGESFMIGVDLATGTVRWSTPRIRGVSMSHSSIIPMAFAGRRFFLYSGVGGLAGVSADKADRGRLLFVHREWNNTVVAPSPVPFPDGRVFLTAGYGAGSMMVRLVPSKSGFTTATVFRTRPKEGLACEQQTPILRDGLLYGVMPKDAGVYKSQFVCFDPDARKFLWTTGKGLTFGLGPFMLAGDVFLLLSETGTLTALEADRAGFTIAGQAEAIPKARDAWGPLALVGRALLLRDSTRLFAVEIE